MNIIEGNMDSALPIRLYCQELLRDIIDRVILDNESKDQCTLVADRDEKPVELNAEDTTIRSLCEELVRAVIDGIIVADNTRTDTDGDADSVTEEIRPIAVIDDAVVLDGVAFGSDDHTIQVRRCG
jgi:hypothetical protein